mgnify:CR=1 FL=1
MRNIVTSLAYIAVFLIGGIFIVSAAALLGIAHAVTIIIMNIIDNLTIEEVSHG